MIKAAPSLESIRSKVADGVRLDRDDGLFLESAVSLNDLGVMANAVRERKNGRVAWYNVNVHLNPTNV